MDNEQVITILKSELYKARLCKYEKNQPSCYYEEKDNLAKALEIAISKLLEE